MGTLVREVQVALGGLALSVMAGCGSSPGTSSGANGEDYFKITPATYNVELDCITDDIGTSGTSGFTSVEVSIDNSGLPTGLNFKLYEGYSWEEDGLDVVYAMTVEEILRLGDGVKITTGGYEYRAGSTSEVEIIYTYQQSIGNSNSITHNLDVAVIGQFGDPTDFSSNCVGTLYR